MVALIVLNYNDSDTTEKFVCSINTYTVIDKIVVVDNASSDGSFERLVKLKSDKIDVIKTNINGGYGYGNNYGALYALDRYKCNRIIISNPDVEVEENTIVMCLNFLKENPEYAIAAPLMFNADNSVNYKCIWKIPTQKEYLFFSGVILGRFFQSMYYKKEVIDSTKPFMQVGCVAGSFLVIDSNRMDCNQLYDENIFLYCEETVLGLKTRTAGYKTALLNECFFIHHHSVSIKKTIQSELMQKKMMWKSRLYVLDNYYKTNQLWKFFTRIVYGVSMVEIFIIGKISNHKNGNEK